MSLNKLFNNNTPTMRFNKLIILFLYSISANAQIFKTDKTDIYKASTIPEELITKQATAVMREYNESYTYYAPDKGTSKVHYIITVLNKNGESWAECSIPYDKMNKISHFSGKMYDSEGKQVKKLKSSDINDVSMYSDTDFANDHRVKVAEFNYGQFPYTVEYEYEYEFSGQMGKDVWQPQSTPSLAVENSSYELKMPATEKMLYKAFNLNKPEPTVIQQTEKGELMTIYQWSVRGLKAYTPEIYTSNQKTVKPRLLITIERFKMQGYEGSNSSWKDFGKFIYQLNAGRDKLPEAFVAQIKDLVKDCTTPLSKVEKLYSYLQKNYRYVSIQFGIGGLQPFPVTDVVAKKYGDCKGLSNLMYAMLKEVGILSYYTLVSAGENYSVLQPDLVGNYFNHAFLCVPLEKDTVWLECTSQNNPVGYCGDFTGGRDVLLITPEGGQVVRTPAYGEKENIQKRKSVLVLDTEGGATAQSETRYSGLQYDLAGTLAAHGNENDVRDFWYKKLKLSGFEIKKINYTIEKKRIPEAIEELNLTISKYASKSGKRLFIQPNIFNKYTFSMPSIEVLGEQKIRHSEVVANDMGYTDEDIIEWRLPEGYTLEHIPEPVKFQSRFGEYESTVKTEGSKMVYTRRMVINNQLHPSESFTELIDFYKNIEKSDKSKVVLVSK